MALQIQQLLYLTVLFAGCGYAAVRGGAPERWGAGLLFCAVVLSNVAAAMARVRFQITYVGEMAVDIAFVCALTAITLRANRFWPMWAAAIQLDEILTHIVMFSAKTGSISYAFTLWLFSLPLPIIIGVAAWRHRQRIKCYGDDPAWS